jgi:hypothetical protein
VGRDACAAPSKERPPGWQLAGALAEASLSSTTRKFLAGYLAALPSSVCGENYGLLSATPQGAHVEISLLVMPFIPVQLVPPYPSWHWTVRSHKYSTVVAAFCESLARTGLPSCARNSGMHPVDPTDEKNG